MYTSNGCSCIDSEKLTNFMIYSADSFLCDSLATFWYNMTFVTVAQVVFVTCSYHVLQPMFLNNNFVWQIVVDLADSDSSVEEFEDASESFTGEDEMFIEDVGSKKLQPLSK